MRGGEETALIKIPLIPLGCNTSVYWSPLDSPPSRRSPPRLKRAVETTKDYVYILEPGMQLQLDLSKCREGIVYPELVNLILVLTQCLSRLKQSLSEC